MENQKKTSMEINKDKLEIVMARVFDAPRELVFAVYTDPKLVPQWWGPRYLTTTVERMDVHPGGAWRFIQHEAGGNQYAFNGEFREVTPPERLVYTFEFEGMPGHVILETVTFETLDGKTRVTVCDEFQSLEDLEGMVETGMEEGAVDSYERMAELLASMQV